MSYLWDVLLFMLGFLAGAGVVLAGLAIMRLRLAAQREGDRLLDRLGPLASQRLLEVAQE